MGYMGLGMQRWISTMRPREFFGKRSKPDGGGVNSSQKSSVLNFYHLRSRKIKTSRKRVYTKEYKAELNKKLKNEQEKQKLLTILSVVIALILTTLLFLYFDAKLDWF